MTKVENEEGEGGSSGFTLTCLKPNHDPDNYFKKFTKPTQDVTPLSGIREEESDDFSIDTTSLKNLRIVAKASNIKLDEIYQKAPIAIEFLGSQAGNFTDEEKEKLYEKNQHI